MLVLTYANSPMTLFPFFLFSVTLGRHLLKEEPRYLCVERKGRRVSPHLTSVGLTSHIVRRSFHPRTSNNNGRLRKIQVSKRSNRIRILIADPLILRTQTYKTFFLFLSYSIFQGLILTKVPSPFDSVHDCTSGDLRSLRSPLFCHIECSVLSRVLSSLPPCRTVRYGQKVKTGLHRKEIRSEKKSREDTEEWFRLLLMVLVETKRCHPPYLIWDSYNRNMVHFSQTQQILG